MPDPNSLPAVIVPAFSGVTLVGNSGATAFANGTVYATVTSAATTGLIEETLASTSLLGNSLTVNTRGLEILAWGTSAANGNSKVAKLYFGSTVLTTMTTTGSAVSWSCAATVLRSGAAT